MCWLNFLVCCEANYQEEEGKPRLLAIPSRSASKMDNRKFAGHAGLDQFCSAEDMEGEIW